MKCRLPHGTKTITYASFNHIQFFASTSWHCAYQRWHSHPTRHCHCWPNASGFTSPILRNLRICHLLYNSSEGKELSQLTPHWSIPPLSNWGIWLLTRTCQHVFTWLCQCHLKLERAKKPSSFYLGHFSSSKSFNHITKHASILYLKSSSRCKLSYFLTSNPSRHTSHHNNWSITSRWFLTYKYG